jgi:DNA-binding NarL/FixJ family response regulator
MGTSGKVSVFLADEQTFFRQGLARELSPYPDLDIMGEAASVDETLAALQCLPPCVLLVCSLTLTHFHDLARKVRHHLPADRILAVADARDPEAIFQAAISGADALLPRTTSAGTWAQTVREVHQGGHPIDNDLAEHPRVARRFLDKFQELLANPGLSSLFTPLTPREAEVLRFLAEGTPLEEISLSLQATPRDLIRNLTSIRRKLEDNSFARETVQALAPG